MSLQFLVPTLCVGMQLCQQGLPRRAWGPGEMLKQNIKQCIPVNRDAGSEVINVRAVSIERKTDTATVRQTA